MNQPGKQFQSPLTVGNLCCLAGIGMILYAAFLLHTAAGFALSGGTIFAYGVILHRNRKTP